MPARSWRGSQNGSLSTFEATRYARGHKALYTLEINGEHASALWDLHDLHRLQWFDHQDEGRTRGWRSVHITDGDHPYMKNWWVPGLQIGYEHSFTHQFADFLQAVGEGKSGGADVPRRAADRLRHRCRAEVGDERALGKSRHDGKGRSGVMRQRTRCSALRVRSSSLLSMRNRAPPGQGRGGRGGGPRGAEPLVMDDQPGFEPIFDGKTLNGWDGDPAFWKVEDGAIVGESTPENAVKENTFIIWRGGEPKDFELKVQFRMNATNSGIQIRSVQLPQGTQVGERAVQGKWVMKGYQADIDFDNTYTGQIYEERGRGFLAMRGQAVYVPDGEGARAARHRQPAADARTS